MAPTVLHLCALVQEAKPSTLRKPSNDGLSDIAILRSGISGQHRKTAGRCDENDDSRRRQRLASAEVFFPKFSSGSSRFSQHERGCGRGDDRPMEAAFCVEALHEPGRRHTELTSTRCRSAWQPNPAQRLHLSTRKICSKNRDHHSITIQLNTNKLILSARAL